VLVTSSDPHTVVVKYAQDDSTRGCLLYDKPFTSIVRLPKSVQPQPPLRVRVELPGVGYTVAARG
jgi:hypothetical protein